jgi:hypothetical protein
VGGSADMVEAPDNPICTDDLIRDAIYYRLFEEAERARWKMSEIPWAAIEHDKVSPNLIRIVREAAIAEMTTHSATKQFFERFSDDMDLTQWMSVWLYEETKHPHVLMRWIHEFGETVNVDAMIRGRAIEPFMNSRVGTLVMNIISEMVASSRYLNLHRLTREPVLARIATYLSADEARHASSFYSYAKSYIDRAGNPDAERLIALKVLYLWINSVGKVQHPVNLFLQRVKNDDDLAAELPFDITKVQGRVCQMIGSLVGIRVEGPGEVMLRIRELTGLVKNRRALA